MFRKSVENVEIETTTETTDHIEFTNDESEKKMSSSFNDDDAMLNDKHVNKKMKEKSDDESDENESFEQKSRDAQRAKKNYANRRSSSDTKKAKCKCANISSAILKRVRRKIAIKIDMKKEKKCLDTLKAIIETRLNEVNLRHVYHRHYFALSDHFDL